MVAAHLCIDKFILFSYLTLFFRKKVEMWWHSIKQWNISMWTICETIYFSSVRISHIYSQPINSNALEKRAADSAHWKLEVFVRVLLFFCFVWTKSHFHPKHMRSGAYGIGQWFRLISHKCMSTVWFAKWFDSNHIGHKSFSQNPTCVQCHRISCQNEKTMANII